MAKTKAVEYGDSSISALKGADRVRKRPAVIFGSDGIDGCQHSVFEILSNSIDEAREGYGKKITVTRFSDGSMREVLGRHQQKCGCGDEAHHGGAQTRHHVLHGRRVHILHEHTADENHQYERRQNECKRCRSAAQYREPFAHAGIVYGGVAAVCGCVDANRTGRHLTYSHDVCELSRCEPSMVVHRLVLYQRQHAVAATESEESNLEERKK